MKYKTQFKAVLSYYLKRLQGKEAIRPCLWYPTDGWTTDPNEMIGELAKDGFTIRKPNETEE